MYNEHKNIILLAYKPTNILKSLIHNHNHVFKEKTCLFCTFVQALLDV